MRKYTSLFVVLAFCARFASAADAGLTAGYANGRAWREMTAVGQLFYIAGLRDTVRYLVPPDTRRLYEPNLTNGEVLAGITKFYESDPVNSRIPVILALRIQTQEAKGVDAKAIDEFRREILRDLPQPPNDQR